MIRYALRCANDHSFESWFASATAFDALAAAGHLACPQCGATKVAKAPMAPALRTAAAAAPPADQPHPDRPPSDRKSAERPLSRPSTELEARIAALRAEVEANSDYVGSDFAAEARAIHDGGAPQRAIWGEARLDEARALIEDGVQVAPLPFRPTRKTN